MNWGLIIKRIRNERGLTQSELSKKSGIKHSHLSNIERGIYKTYKDVTIRKIAFGLDIPLDILYQEIHGIRPTRENYEQTLERLKISLPVNIPVYEDFPFHAGNSIQPIDTLPMMRQETRGKRLEGYIVNGNCLEPEIRDRDIIVVDREAQVDIGNIVACLHNDELYLGKLRKIADEVYLENKDARVKLTDCKAIAKIVEIRRKVI